MMAAMAFVWGFWLGVACEYLHQHVMEERKAEKRIKDSQLTLEFDRQPETAWNHRN